MKTERIYDLLERYKSHPVRENALCAKQKGAWVKFSSDQYYDFAHFFAFGLLEMGMVKGDRIITITNNRPEWNFVDMGMAMIGVIHVPVFTSLSPSEYQYIFSHCKARMILVSDEKVLTSLGLPGQTATGSPLIFSFDQSEGVSNWMEIVESGRKNAGKHREAVENSKQTISPDEVVTLIYTSGTTGRPKGVMLTHRNLVSNFLCAAEIFNLQPDDKFLSILPLCHVGGRLGNYQTQYSGSSIFYAESMGAIARNMAEIRPDGFDAVPRILEKFYRVILSKGEKLSGIKKILFNRAVNLGLRYQPFGGNGWFYDLRIRLADRLIFSKWRVALGGNVRIAGCGGASLPPHLEKIFWAAGIKIINMYGLTETSPIVTINSTEKGKVKLGSVGKPIDDVEVKIADDGEILCKGPNVTPGYYNDPGLTQAAFDGEGWFHTGDIGRISGDGFLFVTDRKKEIFKLSNGKYIAPQPIENIFRESPAIDQIMVIGENRKFASALISPDFRFLEEWVSAQNLTFQDHRKLLEMRVVQEFFNSESERLNRRLSPHEQLHRIRLVPDEWSPATGELSPTLKLRRHFIRKKYEELISGIFIDAR